MAIMLKKDYAVTACSREALRFHKDRLLELGGTHDDGIWKWRKK
jgi:hypothetical protein